MAVYQKNQAASPETLELLIDESILNETPRLQRGLHALKILAMIAPLLGLLGTVVGLIETFQSITLSGLFFNAHLHRQAAFESQKARDMLRAEQH